MKKIKRPSWDQYFMKIADDVSLRSIDENTKTGCVIVDQHHRIVATGYNGFPPGVNDDFWPKNRVAKISLSDNGEKYEITKYDPMFHAEMNALVNATRPIDGATLYCNLFPCHDCTKVAISKGIKKIIYRKFIPGWERSYAIAKELLKQAGVETVRYTD